jgi:hypothetical protein
MLNLVVPQSPYKWVEKWYKHTGTGDGLENETCEFPPYLISATGR